MKERPILMTGFSVRGILEGRKTQTRRMIKKWVLDGDESGWGWEPDFCPYGRPSDCLWVRETWAQVYDAGNGQVTVLPPTGKDSREALRRVLYRATDTVPDNAAIKWRPAIHMPRWACRLALEITGIRIERVQGISYQDMLAEGIQPPDRRFRTWGAVTQEVREEWIRLWNSINTKPGTRWDDNPWVWVIEFKRL